MRKRYIYIGMLLLLLILLIISVGISLKLWVRNKELLKENVPKTKIYQPSYNPDFFIDSNEGNNGVEEQSFLGIKKQFIKDKKDFIAVNLDTMQISLYENGEQIDFYDILSKGKEGSWWETPTGLYSVLSKEASHFSSIGNVWMPWSIQFYGNFFIHGWPYYPGGDPVSKSYSGGCIRLSDENAKPVYEFMEKGMPILVYDTEKRPVLFSRITSENAVLRPPNISAEVAFVADLDTGEVILNKNIDSVRSIASLTKLMTATVASELIYLERGVRITSNMLSDKIQSYPLEIGKYYKAFDLLYPLLQQSSNGAGRAIASMINEKYFIYQMNQKAESLNMVHTEFVDPNGIQGDNISTLRDFSKLAKYIFDKRKFIYDISKGKDYAFFGSNEFDDLKTFNEFYDDPRLIGVKNGESSTAGQTYASVWSLEKDGKSRYIFIGVLGSNDRKNDIEEVLIWLEDNFGF